jgi:hypothetical protein
VEGDREVKALIIFKSGATVEVDIERFSTKKNVMSGAITELKWETPDDWTSKLHTVQLDEIAAIVALRDPGEVE